MRLEARASYTSWCTRIYGVWRWKVNAEKDRVQSYPKRFGPPTGILLLQGGRQVSYVKAHQHDIPVPRSRPRSVQEHALARAAHIGSRKLVWFAMMTVWKILRFPGAWRIKRFCSSSPLCDNWGTYNDKQRGWQDYSEGSHHWPVRLREEEEGDIRATAFRCKRGWLCKHFHPQCPFQKDVEFYVTASWQDIDTLARKILPLLALATSRIRIQACARPSHSCRAPWGAPTWAQIRICRSNYSIKSSLNTNLIATSWRKPSRILQYR